MNWPTSQDYNEAVQNAATSFADLVPEVPPDQDRLLMLRQALHAWRLRFKHPRLDRWMEFEAPLPPDFQSTLDALRQFRAV
jgi:23S rRNA pseudouridine1911/1915/1917 synthase